MADFKEYVDTHMIQRITIGKSGAGVYELNNSRIAKHIQRNALESDSLWNSYKREAQFYSCFSSSTYPFLPKVYHCYQSDDEIQIIMEKYRSLNRYRFDNALLEKILAVLARIHSLPVPDFLPNVDIEPFMLDQSAISQYLLSWQKVLEEHGSAFPKNDLFQIAENINAVNQKAHSTKRVFCHGDFHFENLLEDDHGNIIVCDWQSIHLGHVAGDISFFLSRLSADGCTISKDDAIQIYCNYTNTDITEHEVAQQMSLANLNTSFVFWHNYLHGCSVDRVRDIFEKMVVDLDYLLHI